MREVREASSNSGRNAEPVINAISHFSLWSKTLHCWQKLSKSTNQRVYQDLVYRNALLLKILTSVPAPLSPAPLYFSSLSLLHTALHYLNAWNRLGNHVTLRPSAPQGHQCEMSNFLARVEACNLWSGDFNNIYIFLIIQTPFFLIFFPFPTEFRVPLLWLQ